MGLAGEEQIERWQQHLDLAAEEVFSTMVGVSCAPAEAAPAAEPETIAAVVGLAGAVSGALVLRAGHRAAERIAEGLTGAPSEPAVVLDAVGEVCNMLAGTWKRFDPKLSSGCLLSTPTMVAGDHYEFFSQRAPVRIERAYGFEEETFLLTLFCAPSL